MAFTRNFVFTDPVAAQQAVQYAQLANQEQAQADQAFNERIRTGTQGRISQQNAQQQMALNQAQMQQRALENEKDRISNQTIAGIQAGPRADALKARQLADEAANKAFALDNFNRGTSFAQTLNDPKTPLSLKQKLMQSGDVEMGPDGLWRSRHKNPNESINDIMNRRSGMGQSTISVTPMPSPGFTPRETDFMVPRPSGSSAPLNLSPFETQGFRVLRQSDIINQTVPGSAESGYPGQATLSPFPKSFREQQLSEPFPADYIHDMLPIDDLRYGTNELGFNRVFPVEATPRPVLRRRDLMPTIYDASGMVTP